MRGYELSLVYLHLLKANDPPGRLWYAIRFVKSCFVKRRIFKEIYLVSESAIYFKLQCSQYFEAKVAQKPNPPGLC